MKVKIEKSVARGEIFAPPSKSYAHRLLICGALADGVSEIKGVSDSEDMLATLDCINALGISYTKKNDTVIIDKKGFSNANSDIKILNCRESGSTIRFFIPIALLNEGVYEFYGTERLLSRGYEVYESICKEQNIEFTRSSEKIVIKGKLKSGIFNVRGDISSQFITGLLFALPLLDGDSVINVTTELESAKYIDITIDALNTFGVKIERKNNSFYIKGNQHYKPTNVVTEGDASNAAFLDAFNVLSGDVSVLGLNESTLQADGIYKSLFEKLKDGAPTIDISSCPDLGPILFALAAMQSGAKFTGTRRLRIKESDRAEAMAMELSKLGISVDVYENSVIVHKSEAKKPTEILCGHNDHRIVMALSVILSCLGGEIEGCEAVSKSYPDFFEEIRKIGIRCEVTK